MPNGIQHDLQVLDASQSGAAIISGRTAASRAHPRRRQTAGRVVRHLDNGFAVEFTRLQHVDLLQENLTVGN